MRNDVPVLFGNAHYFALFGKIFNEFSDKHGFLACRHVDKTLSCHCVTAGDEFLLFAKPVLACFQLRRCKVVALAFRRKFFQPCFHRLFFPFGKLSGGVGNLFCLTFCNVEYLRAFRLGVGKYFVDYVFFTVHFYLGQLKMYYAPTAAAVSTTILPISATGMLLNIIMETTKPSNA
ncbi:unknown [Corallococcus sp. CAG:1435]|nr:unknown [Corallococcus sp. CAG:1435]